MISSFLSVEALADLVKTYAQARAQVENAKLRIKVSQEEYTRLKALYAHNQNTSLKALQVAESTWQEDQNNLQSAKEGLLALEGSSRQKWGSVVSGWVFGASQTLSKLIAQQEYLVRITLPAGQDLTVMPAQIEISLSSKKRMKAGLVSPAPYTDPQIQGLSFFYTVLAKPGQLAAGLNVEAELPVGPPVNGFFIPLSALVWQNGRSYVFVKTDPEHFSARTIEAETPLPDGYFVTSGFKTGELLVIEGAQALLSEMSVPRAKSAGGNEEGDEDD